MIRSALTWLAQVLAGHAVLQLGGAAALAYLGGWAVQLWRGAEIVSDALPPLFWPLLTALTLIVTAYHGIAVPMLQWRRRRRQSYRDTLEHAYQEVSVAYKPHILNPAHPGNPHAIREYAQNAADKFRAAALSGNARSEVPPLIDMEDEESVRRWYYHLRQERARYK